jgi:hypothetical protein
MQSRGCGLQLKMGGLLSPLDKIGFLQAPLAVNTPLCQHSLELLHRQLPVVGGLVRLHGCQGIRRHTGVSESDPKGTNAKATQPGSISVMQLDAQRILEDLRYLTLQISALFFLSRWHTLVLGMPVEKGCEISRLIGSK